MDFLKLLTGRKKQLAYKSPHKEARPTRRDGREYTSVGPYNESTSMELGYYHEILRTAQQQRDSRLQWGALENIGDLFLSDGDHRQARTYYEKGLNLAKRINDRRREIGSLSSLSNALEKAGEKVQAKQYHDDIMALARDSHGSMLGDLGIQLASRGGDENLKRGITLFKLHLQITREEENRAGEQMALGNLGTAYLSLGYVHRAIDYIKKALVIAEELNNTDGKQAALGSLATAYKNVGDLQKASKYIDDAVKLSRETGNEYRLAINIFNKARLLVQHGDLKRALPLAEEAAALWARNDDPNVERAKTLVTEILSSGALERLGS